MSTTSTQATPHVSHRFGIVLAVIIFGLWFLCWVAFFLIYALGQHVPL